MEQLMKSVWSPSEVYVCGDPECRSKVLILQGPEKTSHPPTLPRCVCGSILEISGSVEGFQDLKGHASPLVDQGPDEARE